MAEHAECTQKFTQNMTYEQFCANELVHDYCAFHLLQLGELVTGVDAELRKNHPEIPWDVMKRLRDRMAHHYKMVEWSIVWDTITRDIPGLLPTLLQLLRQLKSK